MKEIRELIKESLSSNATFIVHITSNLGWYRYERYVKYLAKIIPKNSVVLDVGCGYGQISAMLKSLRGDLEIFAVDIKHHGCWKGLKKYKVKFSVGNAECLNFKDNTFNVVIAFGLLEHLNNKIKFLKEVHRILKNNGMFLIFNLPNKYSLNEFIAKRLSLWHHDCRFTIKEVENMLSKNGFEIIESRREFFVPALVNLFNETLSEIFNYSYLALQFVDDIIIKTPLKYFASAIAIECRVIK